MKRNRTLVFPILGALIAAAFLFVTTFVWVAAHQEAVRTVPLPRIHPSMLKENIGAFHPNSQTASVLDH